MIHHWQRIVGIARVLLELVDSRPRAAKSLGILRWFDASKLFLKKGLHGIKRYV